MFTALTPEDIKPLVEDTAAIKRDIAWIKIVLGAIEYVPRQQALKMLNVTGKTLKAMADRGEIETSKGKRKVEVSLPSVVAYLMKKQYVPEAIERKIRESRRTESAAKAA